MSLNREAFVSQLATAMMSHVTELEQYLGGSQGGLRTQVYSRARELADLMEDPNSSRTAARAVMAGLYGSNEVIRTFWQTEVGQAVARSIGFHQEAVPYVIAATILGVSRQRVYQLCEEGKLRRIADTNAVTPASVREVLLGAGLRAAA